MRSTIWMGMTQLDDWAKKRPEIDLFVWATREMA